MKTEEDEAFDELARKQGMWGGGFPAKRAAAADKLQEPAQEQEEDWGALAEKQLASIKRDTQASFEDAMVRATHKVMAEREAQPVQEPEAWGFRSADGSIYDCISPESHDECEGSYNVPLYTTPPLPVQPAQEPVADSFEEYCKILPPLWNTHISRTYAEQFFRAGQSAQPAQEPVDIAKFVEGMEVSIDVSTGDHDSTNRLFGIVTLVQQNQGSKHGLILLVQEPAPNFKPAAQPAQEPMATVMATVTSETGNPDVTMSWWHKPALPVGTKLYTAPSKRPWVGLTPEETSGFTQHEMTVVKYVNKVLREKNA